MTTSTAPPEPTPEPLAELAPLAHLIHTELDRTADLITLHTAAYMGRQVADIPQQLAELQQLRAAVHAVRTLHRQEYGSCAACTNVHSVPWPCDTIRALAGVASTPEEAGQ